MLLSKKARWLFSARLTMKFSGKRLSEAISTRAYARAGNRFQELVIEAYQAECNPGFEVDEKEKEVRPRDFHPQTTVAMFKAALKHVGKQYKDITALGRGFLDQDGGFRER